MNIALVPEITAKAAPTSKVPTLTLMGKVGPDEPVSLRVVEAFLDRENWRQGFRISLNSEGGSISESKKIYECVRALPVPVAAHVGAICFSAATRVFLAAGLRTASIESRFLMHPARTETKNFGEWMTSCEFRKHAEVLEREDAEEAEALARRTGVLREIFEAHIKTEEYSSAAQMHDLGVVHEIHGMTPPAVPEIFGRLKALRAKGVFIPVPPLFDGPNFREATRIAAHFLDLDGEIER